MTESTAQPTRLPQLVTARLVLRELAEDDLDAYATTVDRAWARTTPRHEHERNLAWISRNYEALAALHQPPYGDRAVTLRTTGELIGVTGLVPALGPFSALLDAAEHDRFSPEIGLFWLVHPDHQRQGYATEAGSALVGQALAQFRLQRVVATTQHSNVASMAVMRHLGMTIHRWPRTDPPWFQVVGVISSPDPVTSE